MELVKLMEEWCRVYNAHVFLVLTISLIVYYKLLMTTKDSYAKMLDVATKAFSKLDKRQAVAEETNAIKFSNIDKSLDRIESSVEDGKKDTDKKFEAIDKKVDDTVIHLQEKWRHYTSGSGKEARADKEQVYTASKQ